MTPAQRIQQQALRGRPPRRGFYNPDAVLDTSQVDDRETAPTRGDIRRGLAARGASKRGSASPGNLKKRPSYHPGDDAGA